MNTARKFGALVSGVLVLGGLAACAVGGGDALQHAIVNSDAATADGALTEARLTILFELPGLGLLGDFAYQGRTIRFEAVRGPSHDCPDTAPDCVPYEVDTRFLSSSGGILALETGGHGPMDPNWGDDPTSERDVDARDLDFELVREAAEALHAATLAPGLELERERLVNLGRATWQAVLDAPAVVPAFEEDEPESSPHQDGTDAVHSALSVGGGSMSCNCRHVVEIRRKAAFVKGSPFDHSAVLLKVYSVSGSTSKLLGTYATSNHGTAASDPAMSMKCSSTFSRTSNVVPYLKAEPCSTPYASWAILAAAMPVVGVLIGMNGYHVCNDDTIVQYAAIKGMNNPSTSTCSWPDLYAPNCW